MFSIFKQDPVKKLEKKKMELQEKMYKLSHTDRKAADMISQQISELEEKITALLKK